MASRGAVLRGALSIPGAARPTPAPQGNALIGGGGRGLNAPGIGQVSPLAAQLANEGGYARAYGPFLPRPPSAFTQGAFGPFSPILPVPVDAPPEDAERPEARRYEYQVGWNLPVGQPGQEGLKLASFDTLRRLADVYSIARACVEYRKNQIRGIEWDIIPTPDAQKAYQNSPSQMADFGKRRAKAMKFFKRPDVNFFSYATWISALMEEVLVFDALSLLIIPTWGKGKGQGVLGSDLKNLMLVNGPTIRPLINLQGGIPRPPAPAYQQFLYGVPRSDYMTMITGADLEDAGLTGAQSRPFRGDQLLYIPMTPRTWTPYGFSPIERGLIPIMTGLQKQAYQYDVFSESTVPAAYVIPGDTAMTPNQLRELQDALNAIAGDPAWKQKIIVLPPNSKIEPQKQISGADELDQWLGTEITMAFGLTPLEIGISPGRSHSSSSGAQNQMAKMTQDRSEDTGVTPLLRFFADIFNLIITEVCGQDDMQFTFEGLQQEEDQDALTGVLVQQFQNGFRTLDEVRQELNLQPYGLEETSEPLIVTPNGVMPISTAVKSAENAVAQQQAQTEQTQAQTAQTHAGVAQSVAQASQAQASTEHTQAQTMQTHATTANTLSQTQMARESHEVSMNEPSPAAIAAAGKNPTPAHAAARAANREAASTKKSLSEFISPVLQKRAAAEFEALARHLGKGRPVSTWDARFIPASALSDVARSMAEGLDSDTAVMIAKARAVVLEPSEYEWLEKADPKAHDPRWPGWQRDQQLVASYAPQVADAFNSVIGAIREFLEKLFGGAVRVTATWAAQHIRGLIATALSRVLRPLWTEGYALGYRSAAAVTAAVAPATTAPAPPVAPAPPLAAPAGGAGSPPLPRPFAPEPDWGGWEPGDVDAAARVSGGDRLTQLLEQWGVNTIQSVSETKLDDLARQIAEALVEGQSAGTLARRIQDALVIPERAEMIAQTEIARAVTAGTLDRYDEDGIDRKEWLVAPDERVCRVCRTNEAEGAIPLSQVFSDGKDGPPGHPRCRCALLPASAGGFDLSDMMVEPLPGFNTVPLRQPALAKQHDGERAVTCDQGHKHWGAKGAAGILIRAPRPDGTTAYLLQQRSKTAYDHKGAWSTFGGGLLPGETPEEGARREVKEEAGSLKYTLGSSVDDDHGGWKYTTFTATAPETSWPPFDGETPEENAGWGWFTPDEMKDLKLHPAFKKMLPKLLAAERAEKAATHSKSSVDYRTADDSHRCGNCVMFRGDHCTLVKGAIEADHTCDRWYPENAEKQSRRTIGLSGQEAWQDVPDAPPPAAGGGAPSMPPVPGGVVGATAGGEPPRWDGSGPEPRVMSAPDDAGDGKWPEGRAAATGPRAPFPAPYMDGYWPGGKIGTMQAGTSSPGGKRGVPPSTVGADLVKVGPEGYIHGYICVRPPCGPRYTQVDLDKKKGQVLHNGVKIGRVPSKDADGKYSAVHIGRGDDGSEVRTKLPARFDTPQQAFAAIPVYHDALALEREALTAPSQAHLRDARAAIAAGELSAAATHLRAAAVSERAAGSDGLATHIEHLHAEVADVPGVEPRPVTSQAASNEITCKNCGKRIRYNEPGTYWFHEQNSSDRCPIAGVSTATPDDDQMRRLAGQAPSVDAIVGQHGLTIADAQGVVNWHRATVAAGEPASSDHTDALWNSNAGTANLTDAEKDAIGKAYYSTQGPFTQHILRYPAESERAGLRLSPEAHEGVDTLRRAIAGAQPFTQPATLYQGTVEATKLYGKTGEKIGQTVTDNGFMSTSASSDVAENYIGFGPRDHNAAMITVHAQPGARALKADESIMLRAGNEAGTADRLREYTFAPGTPLRIISDAKTGPRGRREIHVEIGPHDVVTASGNAPEHAPESLAEDHRVRPFGTPNPDMTARSYTASRDEIASAHAAVRQLGDLAPDEQDAVNAYLSAKFGPVNDVLRHGDSSPLTPLFRQVGGESIVRRIDQAMSSSPASAPFTTYRVLPASGPSAVFGDGWSARDLTGSTWEDKAYTSTSASGSSVLTSTPARLGGGVFMRIRVPAGTHAISISPSNPAESEVLLDRGMSFHVTRDHGVVNGVKEVDVEVTSKARTESTSPGMTYTETPGASAQRARDLMRHYHDELSAALPGIRQLKSKDAQRAVRLAMKELSDVEFDASGLLPARFHVNAAIAALSAQGNEAGDSQVAQRLRSVSRAMQDLREVDPFQVHEAPEVMAHAPKPPVGDLPPVAQPPSRGDELRVLAGDPKAFDTQLMEVHKRMAQAASRASAALDVIHRMAGDRQEYRGSKRVWGMTGKEAVDSLRRRVAAGNDNRDLSAGMTPSEALAKFDAEMADHQKAKDEIAAHDAVFSEKPWSRFFPCTNPGGHIHRSLRCSTLRDSTPMGWAPELSGKTEAEAVDQLDDALCSVCFPSAPVALQTYVPRGPQAERDKRAQERAAREVERAKKTLADDERFKDDSGSWVTTVTGAKTAVRDEIEAAAYYPHLFTGGKRDFTRAAQDAERVLLAREAANPGTGATTEEIAKIRESTAKRIRKESKAITDPERAAQVLAAVDSVMRRYAPDVSETLPVSSVTEEHTGTQPFTPSRPQRAISHKQLDAQRIASDLNEIAAGRDKVPGIAHYYMPGNDAEYLAKMLNRGKEELLYPKDTPYGGEHQDAGGLRILRNEIRRLDKMLSSGKVSDYSADTVPEQARPVLKSMRDRLAALRDEIAAADTSTPFQQGDFTQNTRKALAGGFDDHLSEDQRVSLRELIDDKSLSYEESSGKDARLKALKNAFTEAVLRDAGLPDNAAGIIARYGVDDLIGGWSMSGDMAQGISDRYQHSMGMTEPPELRVTDFAGKRTDEYMYKGPDATYSDMSPEAKERRRLALDYWVPRAQQHYTNQVLREVNPAGKPVKAVRYVYGAYADAIKDANARGDRWTANTRTLSSWAEPKGATTAKSFVKRFGDPLRLEQAVDPSQVFAHWRGESTLRNGVKVKGEIIVRDSKLSNETTNVVEPPKPPPPAPKRPRW